MWVPYKTKGDKKYIPSCHGEEFLGLGGAGIVPRGARLCMWCGDVAWHEGEGRLIMMGLGWP